MNASLNTASNSFFSSDLLKYTSNQVVYLKDGELKIRNQHWGFEWILRSDFVESYKGVNSKASDVKDALVALSSRSFDAIDVNKKKFVEDRLWLLFSDLGVNNQETEKLVSQIVVKLFSKPVEKTGTIYNTTLRDHKKTISSEGPVEKRSPKEAKQLPVKHEMPVEGEKLLFYKEFRTRLLQIYPKEFVEEKIRVLRTKGWIIESQMGSGKLDKIEEYIKESYDYSISLLTSHEKFIEIKSVLKTINPKKNPHIQAKKALEILKELEGINPDFESLTKNLMGALELLSRPQPFSLINYVLGSFAQSLGGKFDKEGKEELVEASKLSGAEVICSHIQENIDDLPKLESNISKVVKDTKNEFLSVMMTLLRIPNKKTPVDLEKNIQRCIDYADQIDQMFRGSYEFVVREFINEQNKRTNNRFGEILSELSYLDPRSRENESSSRKDVCLAIYKKFITPCIQALAEGNTPTWPKSDILQENIDDLLGDELKANIPVFEWIIKNYEKIIKVYNQFNDDNYNMGYGTCLYNSLDRIALLIKNPNLDMNMIDMKSSETARTFEASLRLRKTMGSETINGTIQIGEYLKKKNLSINEGTKYPSSPKDAISEALKAATASKKSNILLLLDGSETVIGHAVNIYLRGNEIFLCDDNLGIIKFKNNKNDIIQFVSYFKVLCPHYPRIGYSFIS